jgi:hypothetical protein
MKNVTLSISDELLKLAREYAQVKGTTLNAMIREFLKSTVVKSDSSFKEELNKLREEIEIDSRQKMTRDEMYER